MRWRLDGATWGVAPSLQVLLIQADEAWPTPHGSDGTLGNVSHSNRISDHNPDENGIVRAADIGEVTEDDAFNLAEAIRLSKDPRIKYVIHERRMFSSYSYRAGDGMLPPFIWRYYGGTNGHWSHVHISVHESNQNDTSPWDIGVEEMITRQDKADEGLKVLAGNFQDMKDVGVFSSATQPGGVTFNDEFATFLLRFEYYIVEKYGLGPADHGPYASLVHGHTATTIVR